jgi:hypothetical protein
MQLALQASADIREKSKPAGVKIGIVNIILLHDSYSQRIARQTSPIPTYQGNSIALRYYYYYFI